MSKNEISDRRVVTIMVTPVNICPDIYCISLVDGISYLTYHTLLLIHHFSVIFSKYNKVMLLGNFLTKRIFTTLNTLLVCTE